MTADLGLVKIARELQKERDAALAEVVYHVKSLAREREEVKRLAREVKSLEESVDGFFCGECHKDPNGCAGRCACCGQEF